MMVIEIGTNLTAVLVVAACALFALGVLFIGRRR